MKRRILYLGNKLAAKGFTPTNIDTLGPLLEQEGYELFYAGTKKSKQLRFAQMILMIIKCRKQVDYILLDTYSTQYFWFAYTAARLCYFFNLKYIPILHGGDLPKRLSQSPKSSRFLFENSFQNVSPSLYLKDAFEKAGFRNIEVIPNSISLADYPFHRERSYKQPKILWVRSFAAIYNPMLALRLVEELISQYPGIHLTMVGPDKDGSLKRCQEYALEHKLPVNFTGKLSKTEWISRSMDFDIFLNTTHYDNTPVSVIEAMALGLPVLSTRVGGIPFLLKHGKTGLLYEDSDLTGLLEQVERVVKDQDKREEIISRARLKAEEYDWCRVKNKWHKLLT
ncbi:MULTISPECIES: glycosyltransferase family 4 protein [unclassified Leeuwenhoekiella]|uniref:glycosyltransferase family 4 protein n=1 Tax=unclassified Leeuwenhoekiella TaxID=2615029 RepID=UPI000C635AED|nr:MULTISPECIES: glycosyltransferase family 4 protein [unclassified Leeuwenhoekiella]MAW96681.1 glycosyl transferase family 1 [Leeuwenhoekiella sp.]MBA81570.1 glycosyl transferase family 1 [Leeuwenhoekiella sp.]|tara:strand:- start:81949 stop:82965 length:1017 start_codon:yes stop_codon:yes gene_type:complete